MVRDQIVKIEVDLNKHGGPSTAEKTCDPHFKNDCKVSVMLDIDSVHVDVKRKPQSKAVSVIILAALGGEPISFLFGFAIVHVCMLYVFHGYLVTLAYLLL